LQFPLRQGADETASDAPAAARPFHDVHDPHRHWSGHLSVAALQLNDKDFPCLHGAGKEEANASG
jgi:hypothetical protein